MDNLADSLQEFSEAQYAQPPLPAPPPEPTGAENLARLAEERRAFEDLKPIIAEYKHNETLAELSREVRQAKDRHGLQHVPEAAIEAALLADTEGGMTSLQELNAQLSHALAMDSTISALMSVRGQSFDRLTPSRPSNEALFQMNDRDWANYKAGLLREAEGRT